MKLRKEAFFIQRLVHLWLTKCLEQTVALNHCCDVYFLSAISLMVSYQNTLKWALVSGLVGASRDSLSIIDSLAGLVVC